LDCFILPGFACSRSKGFVMNNMMVPLVLFCLFCLPSLVLVPDAAADYYRYTDGGGVVSMTNKLESVPARYRSTMKVIREDPPAKKIPQARKEAPPEAEVPAAPVQAGAAEPASVPAGKFAELSARFIWFKPLFYLGAFLATFIAIVKVTALLPSALLSKLIYLAFFLGVFVFLYKAYVEHVVSSTRNIKEKAVTMMKKANAREQAEPVGEPGESAGSGEK